MRKFIGIFVILISCPLLFITPCFAGWGSSQTTLKGYCIDSSTGRALANAKVSVYTTSRRLVISTYTNPNGFYYLQAKLSGHYTLEASASGYQTNSLAVSLKSGRTYSFNFRLKRLSNRPPQITALTPKDKSTFITGDTINISVTAYDPDQDPLQYRYTIDSKVLKDWTGLNTFSLKTSKSDWGRHRIKVEVRDKKLATDSKTNDIFIFINFPKPASQ